MTKAPRKLLVVEDDPGLQRQLRWSFENYDVLLASDREEAMAHVRSEEPAVVTLDLGLPPDVDGASEGLAVLEEILSANPHAKVIVVTGNEDRKNAVRAIGLGAYDFYLKPIEAEVLCLIIDRAFHLSELELENQRLVRGETGAPLRGVITSSPEMVKICQVVEKVALSDVSVLLLGESGTGKELLARALHEMGQRSAKRFVAINCAAIPENLLESELFGYERGAFTGAVKQTKGKIELADGGTLFLDEIGDLPLSLQVKLLRFLQERVLERIGGRQEIPVNVRVVCATHQDLPELIQKGSFREDLYYRLSELVVKIPPLRDRDDDSVLLARNFLSKFSREHNRSIRGLSNDAIASIEQHSWPGNVRELENRMKRAVIMCEGNRLNAKDLDLAPAEVKSEPVNLKIVRELAERHALRRALAQSDTNISRAAKLLGVSRPTLYDLLRYHDIKV